MTGLIKKICPECGLEFKFRGNMICEDCMDIYGDNELPPDYDGEYEDEV